MAEATVSTILEQMTAITIDKAIEAWSLVQGAEKEVKRLETNFKALWLELEDAEEKEYVDKQVKLWLDKFRDVSYDMEDVLDEWETVVQQLQTDPSCSASVRKWKDEQPEVQGPAVLVSTERGSTISPIEYSDVAVMSKHFLRNFSRPLKNVGFQDPPMFQQRTYGFISSGLMLASPKE
ncbi:hypothetical protein ES319_A01G125900v1 [Gossypium barbadense]|uniref:Disease resistance N-terminal domain-containing protein n=1 Tax=Gossypium barbadense TaxID=3634 RepID=A0A5J5WVC3_GOSBA|nr:hypothetical protein ES319_A01G125900v1 [Gossypium barbadense]KAB2096722.1 hypothetical protein ES319_A01G125900v1 [Gossypium barbadense]KAB2096727.1 hypothetical protein ES319_A01G125900v1 [Gossypium barbadense]